MDRKDPEDSRLQSNCGAERDRECSSMFQSCSVPSHDMFLVCVGIPTPASGNQRRGSTSMRMKYERDSIPAPQAQAQKSQSVPCERRRWGVSNDCEHRACAGRDVHPQARGGRSGRTKAGMPAALQPSMISLLPAQFEVMKTTSAPHESYASLTSFITSGRPPISSDVGQYLMRVQRGR